MEEKDIVHTTTYAMNSCGSSKKEEEDNVHTTTYAIMQRTIWKFKEGISGHSTYSDQCK